MKRFTFSFYQTRYLQGYVEVLAETEAEARRQARLDVHGAEAEESLETVDCNTTLDNLIKVEEVEPE